MTKELTQEFAFGLGYELIYRTDRFILEGIGMPNIKDIDSLPPEAAISFAHKIISTAHMAKCVEGMAVPDPEKENNSAE